MKPENEKTVLVFGLFVFWANKWLLIWRLMMMSAWTPEGKVFNVEKHRSDLEPGGNKLDVWPRRREIRRAPAPLQWLSVSHLPIVCSADTVPVTLPANSRLLCGVTIVTLAERNPSASACSGRKFCSVALQQEFTPPNLLSGSDSPINMWRLQHKTTKTHNVVSFAVITQQMRIQ